MSNAVACPSCKARFTASDEAAGKTAHCTKCGSAITVPIPPRPLATEKQEEFARDLGIQFPDNIDRRAISELIDAAVANQDED